MTLLLVFLVSNESIETKGVDSFQTIPTRNLDPYLSFLLDSREIIIMPMTNAYGYFHNLYRMHSHFIPRRQEGVVDVNRDFPFDYPHPPYHCFQSETSRALQILYTHNMFLATITFHAGMQSITYEWGDYYNRNKRALSPDHHSMKDVAEAISRFCG